jgi:cell cycle checkpoint control protein RAD9A
VKKTYKLTYESAEILHAMFDRNAAKNRWVIGAQVLRLYVEYFGPKTEHLDINHEGGRVLFTSYTEKITHERGLFKLLEAICSYTNWF